MRNPTNSSRTSLAIALSLEFLAITLSGSALAGDRKDAFVRLALTLDGGIRF